MEPSNDRAPNRGPLPTLLPFLIAYVASRAIFAAFGFHYNVFGDHFDAGKLLIDLGVWTAVYLAAVCGLKRLPGRR